MTNYVMRLKPQVWQRSLNLCKPLDSGFERPNSPKFQRKLDLLSIVLPWRSRESRNCRVHREVIGSILGYIDLFLVAEKLELC